ncbi:hypothetical protein BH24BAC1_BH24BAC1_02970 [soil metagenome]
MKKKLILIVGAGVVCLGLWGAFRPVKPTKQNSRNLSAVVADVKETENKDVLLTFYGDRTVYYLNRGVEQGLDVKVLREQLLNNMVDITFVDHWTPLDPVRSLKPVASLTVKGKILYSGLQEANP